MLRKVPKPRRGDNVLVRPHISDTSFGHSFNFNSDIAFPFVASAGFSIMVILNQSTALTFALGLSMWLMLLLEMCFQTLEFGTSRPQGA